MFDDDEQVEWEWHRNCQTHRTLVEFLLHSHQPEAAATILEGSVEVRYSRRVGKTDTVYIDIPPAGYPLVAASSEMQQSIRMAVREVVKGYLSPEPNVHLRMKLLPTPDDAWPESIKTLIVQYRGTNQGLVSELAAGKQGRPLHTWNEIKYASASEIRIAQELESRKVLFFPLAVAVRAETGKNWQDHREVDFLLCHNGAWGVLEVSYHPDRYEHDAEKDVWFKRSGLLCIQHYTAEKCYKEPSKVVEEFLLILKQYEK